MPDSAVLKKLRRDLRRLVLPASITDASARVLRELRNLIEIDISQTQIGTKKDWPPWGRLPKLRTVYLGKQVTDAGLKALSASPSLKALDLSANQNHGSRRDVLSPCENAGRSGTQPDLRRQCMLDVPRGVARAADARAERHARHEQRPLSLGASEKTRGDFVVVAKRCRGKILQGMAKLKQLKTIVLNGVPLPEATMAQLKQLGAPSPWDSIAGLEHARFRATQKIRSSTALSAPVAAPRLRSKVASDLPTTSRPSPRI